MHGKNLIMVFRPSIKRIALPALLSLISIFGSLWFLADNPVTRFGCLVINIISIPFVEYMPWLYYSDKPILTPAGILFFGVTYSIILYEIICLINLLYEKTERHDPF
jgi:hypothetical protein